MFGYTIFIMLLPLLSFIVLGLAGMKMQHKVAGLIGTCSLGMVTILSYITAFQYFFGLDRVNGVYQTFVPYNFNVANVPISCLRPSSAVTLPLY